MTLDLSRLSDGELADLSRAGRQAAFAELVRRHRQPIYRLILGNVADADEALDLVQDTFVSAYRALSHYDRTRPMRTWLSRIALNKCRDWSRRRRVRRFLNLAWRDEFGNLPEAAPGPDVIAADRDHLARVALMISRLPQPLREPFVLCQLEGLSQMEAASVLSVTEKAVETRIRRARDRLNAQLAPSIS